MPWGCFKHKALRLAARQSARLGTLLLVVVGVLVSWILFSAERKAKAAALAAAPPENAANG